MVLVPELMVSSVLVLTGEHDEILRCVVVLVPVFVVDDLSREKGSPESLRGDDPVKVLPVLFDVGVTRQDSRDFYPILVGLYLFESPFPELFSPNPSAALTTRSLDLDVGIAPGHHVDSTLDRTESLSGVASASSSARLTRELLMMTVRGAILPRAALPGSLLKLGPAPGAFGDSHRVEPSRI